MLLQVNRALEKSRQRVDYGGNFPTSLICFDARFFITHRTAFVPLNCSLVGHSHRVFIHDSVLSKSVPSHGSFEKEMVLFCCCRAIQPMCERKVIKFVIREARIYTPSEKFVDSTYSEFFIRTYVKVFFFFYGKLLRGFSVILYSQ
jgi:hypothetical protein